MIEQVLPLFVVFFLSPRIGLIFFPQKQELKFSQFIVGPSEDGSIYLACMAILVRHIYVCLRKTISAGKKKPTPFHRKALSS